MKTRRTLICLLITFVLQACFDKAEIIFPEGEITRIYNITDTSATFDVVITRPSNAQWDEAYEIWLDTIPLEENPPLEAGGSAPDTFFTITVSELMSNTHYFARLRYYGTFDVGGPNESMNRFIGEQKEFTTLP